MHALWEIKQTLIDLVMKTPIENIATIKFQLFQKRKTMGIAGLKKKVVEYIFYSDMV